MLRACMNGIKVATQVVSGLDGHRMNVGSKPGDGEKHQTLLFVPFVGGSLYECGS